VKYLNVDVHCSYVTHVRKIIRDIEVICLFMWYLQYFRGSLQVVTQIYEYLSKFPNQQLYIFNCL